MLHPVRAAALLLAVLLGGLLGAPAAAAQDVAAPTAEVTLRVGLDGSLGVTEVLTVPAGGRLERTVALRTDVGGARERVLAVREQASDGSATVAVSADALTVSAGPGTSTVRYVVDGALAGQGDGVELAWQAAGTGSATGPVVVDVEAPAVPLSVSCRAGAPGSGSACTSASSGPEQGGSPRLTQDALAAGGRLEVLVVLPAGAVPATARFEDTFTLARAFRPSPGAGLGAVVVLAVLGVAAGLLYRLRGRDEPVAGGHDVLPLLRGPGGTRFASPDGVLPGQVGTVVDERVDPVDVTATVLDLAVRGHLQVSATPGDDGTVFGFAATGVDAAALRPYERGVLGLVADAGLAEVRERARDGLDAVRDALYAEVVAQGWFERRPDVARGRWTVRALGLLGVCIVVTVVLAAVSTLGLVGVAAVLGALGVLVAARAVPARTARGSALVDGLAGMRRFLDVGDLAGIEPEHREEVLLRCLPYAVVLDRLARWTGVVGGVDSAADGRAGWAWLTAPTAESARLAGLTVGLCDALDAAFTQAGHLRRLR